MAQTRIGLINEALRQLGDEAVANASDSVGASVINNAFDLDFNTFLTTAQFRWTRQAQAISPTTDESVYAPDDDKTSWTVFALPKYFVRLLSIHWDRQEVSAFRRHGGIVHIPRRYDKARDQVIATFITKPELADLQPEATTAFIYYLAARHAVAVTGNASLSALMEQKYKGAYYHAKRIDAAEGGIQTVHGGQNPILDARGGVALGNRLGGFHDVDNWKYPQGYGAE